MPTLPPFNHCRDRASVRRFQEGKASVYAVIAKDQLMSFTDLSFAACSSRENTETEASARSQRETAEAKAAGRPTTSERLGALGSSALIDEADTGRAVAAAPSLVDVRMDEHWCAVSPGTRHGCLPSAVCAKKGETDVDGLSGSCWENLHATHSGMRNLGALQPGAIVAAYAWNERLLVSLSQKCKYYPHMWASC